MFAAEAAVLWALVGVAPLLAGALLLPTLCAAPFVVRAMWSGGEWLDGPKRPLPRGDARVETA